MRLMRKREARDLIGESYQFDTPIVVRCAGEVFTGVVLDINQGWSFVLRTTHGNIITVYDDEVVGRMA